MIKSFLDFLSYEKRYSVHTILSYQNDLSQYSSFLKDTFDDIPTNSSYNMVRSWVVHLMEAQIDVLSINRKIACLRSFYKFLLQREVIGNNPMDRIKILKSKHKLPQYLQEKEVIELLDSQKIENTHDYWLERLIIELLYGTGIRLAELIGLKEANINLQNQTIKVLGKRNKERIIPISSSLKNAIIQYREVRNREISIGEHGFLLVTKSGAKCYPMFVHRIVKSRLGDSSVDKRSPHVFRHTYATHLLNRGADLGAVKNLLGHSSLAATQIYTHNSIEKLKKVFNQAHPKA